MPRDQMLVHEVGHWLGLDHTFANGCRPPGDGIADTPAEAKPAFSCTDQNRDTCPKLPGKDPTNNYMTYVPDSCMSVFTAGQRAAMRAVWFTYRDPAGPTVEPVPAPTPAPIKVVVPVNAPVPVAAPVTKIMMGMMVAGMMMK
jgi:Pregnancy-associated plasma protein-A